MDKELKIPEYLNITNEDNMKLMARYPDNYFDLAIVDLEYGIGASKPSLKPNTAVQKNGNRLNIKQPNYTPKNWDFKKSDENYLNELFRVSKNQIIWGANYYGLVGGMIVWDKLNFDSDQMDCEIAYCSLNQRCDLVYYMWAGMFQGIYCGKDVRRALIQQGNKQLNEKRIHPTQKPVPLYTWLLQNYTKPNDKIIDTHLGSGSIAIAIDQANKIEGMNLTLTACELDKDYYNDAMNRISEQCDWQPLLKVEKQEIIQTKLL